MADPDSDNWHQPQKPLLADTAASLSDSINSNTPSVKSVVSSWFAWHGRNVARRPLLVALVAFLIAAGLGVGMLKVSVISEPQKIWVPADSQTAIQQDAFDTIFDPFYRINQVILTVKPEYRVDGYDNILEPEFLADALDIQNWLINGVSKDGAHLQDSCFKPITPRPGHTLAFDGCLFESALSYWRSNMTRIRDLDYQSIQDGLSCKSVDSYIGCQSQIGVPVIQNVVFGGLQCYDGPGNQRRHLCAGGCDQNATALMITFLLNDYEEVQESAKSWEKDVFLRLLHDYKKSPDARLDVSFMAQRSIQDELVVVENQNKYVVVISYICMFGYIILSLGKFPHPVKTRVSLGFQGIVIVACSVAASIGLVSLIGVSITMIVTEVVPFLILAIGVDNMFIITKAWDKRIKTHPMESIEDRAAGTMAEIGPTITAAAVSEVLAFSVGCTTNIPALKSFCLVASVAVLIDFLLQITWFLAAVSIDAKRIAARRADVCCCIRVRETTASSGRFWKLVLDGEYVKYVLEKYYAPYLMLLPVRIVVVVLWAVFLGISIYGAGQLKLGLDQNLVLPTGSYLSQYFDQQTELGQAGPPAYVVLQNVNYSHPDTGPAIDKIINGLAKESDIIEPPITNWFGRFQYWDSEINYNSIAACKKAQTCDDCPMPLTHDYPMAERLHLYLYNISLSSLCCQTLGHCGAQFAPDVKLLWKVVNGKKTPIEIMHTRLRTQHTPLSNQSMFIRNMQVAQHTVAELSKDLPQVDLALYDLPKHPVIPPKSPTDDNDNMHYQWVEPAKGSKAFAYSLFYVYYEQYSYIRGIALQNILLALGAVFVAAMLISSPGVSVFVVVCVASVCIDLIGFIWAVNPPADNDSARTHVYSVDINAVSVVNMVMSIGLAVEFCVHIATAFATRQGESKIERAKYAVAEMGSSVITGITLTKLTGVLVLAWAPSILFRLYYFRIYAAIILCGVFHGLIFLPVILSFIGPEPTDSTEDAQKLKHWAAESPLLSDGNASRRASYTGGDPQPVQRSM